MDKNKEHEMNMGSMHGFSQVTWRFWQSQLPKTRTLGVSCDSFYGILEGFKLAPPWS